VAVASAWVAAGASTLWDYKEDAGPAVDALAHLRLHEFLVARPIMGPLSIIVRAPFAALGQLVDAGGVKHGYLSDYRFGIFPCLVVAGIFGLVLARMLERDRRPLVARVAVVVLAVINPVSLRAIHFGHPEEILGAALLAAAAVAAVRGRLKLAAALLGLALVNKQWALIGAPAVVITLWGTQGWTRLKRPLAIFAGIAAVVTAPLLIADAGSLFDLTRNLADLRGSYLFPASIWYPYGTELGPDHFVQMSRGLRDMPQWIAITARPLIALMAIVVPLALRKRVWRDPAARALPLLALVMLLRCALDPADNGYYHAPFFYAVLAADALVGRFYATAAAVVLLQLPTTLGPSAVDLNRFYVCWASIFAVYLGGRASGLDWVALIRQGVRRPLRAPS